jgi:hypothetical protein
MVPPKRLRPASGPPRVRRGDEFTPMFALTRPGRKNYESGCTIVAMKRLRLCFAPRVRNPPTKPFKAVVRDIR